MPMVDELVVDSFACPEGEGDLVEESTSPAQIVCQGGHRVPTSPVHEADASLPLANETSTENPE